MLSMAVAANHEPVHHATFPPSNPKLPTCFQIPQSGPFARMTLPRTETWRPRPLGIASSAHPHLADRTHKPRHSNRMRQSHCVHEKQWQGALPYGTRTLHLMPRFSPVLPYPPTPPDSDSPSRGISEPLRFQCPSRASLSITYIP